MVDVANEYLDAVKKVVRTAQNAQFAMKTIGFISKRFEQAMPEEPQMDPRKALDVKHSIQDNYSFDHWTPIDKSWFDEGAEPVWCAYAFVQEPAIPPIPHATMFFRRRTGLWKSIGLKWKPRGDFLSAAATSLSKQCTGITIQSPEPSSQLLAKRPGKYGRDGDYITVVWCGLVDPVMAEKLRTLLAGMKLSHNDRFNADYLKTTTEPMNDKDYPVEAFRGKGYMLAGRNCATLVEEIMEISCMKTWYNTSFGMTDPASCKFDEKTHPVDTRFLDDQLPDAAAIDGGSAYDAIPGRKLFTDWPTEKF